MSDREVHDAVIHRRGFNYETYKERNETLMQAKRRWLVNDGQKKFIFPKVAYTFDERRGMTYNGKRKLTAKDHIHNDRVRVHYVHKTYEQRYAQ